MNGRARIACGLALVWLGCSCGDETTTTPPSSAAAPPASAPPPTSLAPPSAVAAAPRGAPTDEQRHQVAALVRTARATERTGDHAAAMTAFDAALAITPFDARVLCEAGFVAHRAQRDALAAQRIDTALAIFGAPSSVADAQRDQLAMCLYNRGLVDEALGDPAAAVVHYTQSLALRPNDTVQARRTAASSLPAAAHVGDTMDGVPVELRDAGLFVATLDRARLEAAMRTGFAGANEFEYTYADPSETRLEVLAERADAEAGARPTIVYRVSAEGAPVGATDVVIALAAEGGWFLFIAAEGGSEEHMGMSWERSFERATVTAAGAYLRIAFDGHAAESESSESDPPDGVAATYCQYVSSDDYVFHGAAYCRPGARPACFAVAEAGIEPFDGSLTTWCYDDADAEVALPNGGEETPHGDGLVTTITLGDDGRFTIRQTPPPEGTGATSEPQTFGALVANGTLPQQLTDRTHAQFRTEGDGWYE